MTRLPRLGQSALLAAAVLAVGAIGQNVLAQTETTAVAAPAASPLLGAAEDFWHYVSVGRFDLATDKAKALEAGKPADVLAAFEQAVERRNMGVASELRVNLDESFLSWQRIPEVKENTINLMNLFQKARLDRASNLDYIKSQVQRLSNGRRAYLLAVDQLKASGELSVPVILASLKDPAYKNSQVELRGALKELGYRALNPLLAATESIDPEIQQWVVLTLGDLGYDAAGPELLRIATTTNSATMKKAAQDALAALHVSSSASLAQLYYEQAEKYYKAKGAITPVKDQFIAYMWKLNGANLEKLNIPAEVFNDNMALMLCEKAIKADPTRGDAVSLWLAAAYRREVDLPKDAVDPFWNPERPAAHFYAVSAGTRHLNAALNRALNDNNPAVALKALTSMQEIVGASNIYEGEETKPLLAALNYPDRKVRFEAALAVAQSLPQKAFNGQDRIIPVLSEAIIQSGKPGVLVLSSQEAINAWVSTIEATKKYTIRAAATPEAVMTLANTMPGIDVVIIPESDPGAEKLLSLIGSSLQTQRASRLMLVASKTASKYATIAASNGLFTVTTSTTETPEELIKSIDDARNRSGGLPLEEKSAGEYTLRAINMVSKLAISRGQVFDLTIAQSPLIQCLNDERAEVAKAAGEALGRLATPGAEAALAAKATNESVEDELRIAFLKDLAVCAKFGGNKLDSGKIDQIVKIAQTNASNEVRSAAAEALGALNIASDKYKPFILDASAAK